MEVKNRLGHGKFKRCTAAAVRRMMSMQMQRKEVTNMPTEEVLAHVVETLADKIAEKAEQNEHLTNQLERLKARHSEAVENFKAHYPNSSLLR